MKILPGSKTRTLIHQMWVLLSSIKILREFLIVDLFYCRILLILGQDKRNIICYVHGLHMKKSMLKYYYLDP